MKGEIQKMKRIYKNGKIFTSDAGNPWADTLVVEDGIFTFVGRETDLNSADTAAGIQEIHDGPKTGESREICDLGGRLVIPGLIDAHTHIGLSVIMGEDDEMPVWDCKSKQEVLDRLKKYVKKHPFRLYYCMFFGQVEALGSEGLNRHEIDKVVKHRPVVLVDQECHSAWLNSGALRFLGIKEDTPDLAPGYSYYERDKDGKLTGCLKEMTMLPILEMNGKKSDKEMKKGILKIMNYLLERGVTTVYDAGNYLDEESNYRLLAEMDRNGELPLRYEATHIIDIPSKAENAIEEFKRLKGLYETEHVKFKTMKIMFDGTHRAHTAKLVEPYNDADTVGGTMLSYEGLYRLLKDLNHEKIDFHAHTVGEGASRMILDCVEQIKKKEDFNIIVTLAHLESQRDEDIPRFKELGVVADYSPHWHGGNDYAGMEATSKLLGEKRAHNLFRANTMVKSGAVVTFSSDEVTLSLLDRWNPYLGIETGHTRQEVNDGGRSAEIFPPEAERLSIEDLIRGYTINAAYALRLDDEIGSIQIGKSADMVILGDDLFEMDPYRIHEVVPEAVIVRGNTVKGSIERLEEK